MPLPDKYADEVTFAIEDVLWSHRQRCLENLRHWRQMLDEAEEAIREQMAPSNATAVTVDGKKVAYYRPQNTYATKRLQEDYPELTGHYIRSMARDELDMAAFAAAHPEIAEKYRVRAFKEAK
jgi:hypothetical protein